MLAVVVSVLARLLVAVFTVTHLLIIYSLSHCVDSETFSDQNQGIGFTLAWFTIVLEPDQLFFPLGKFRRICMGH